MKRLALVAGLSLAVSLGAVACDDDDSGDAPTQTTATEVGSGTGGDAGVGTGTTSGAATAPGDGAGSGASGGDAETFRLDFQPLNGSGVTGTGTVRRGADGRLSLDFTAEGLTPGRRHLQHVHEPGGQDAQVRCPDEQDDADGDGTVSLQESEAAYGPVRLDLAPYPSAEGGRVAFRRSYAVPQRLRPLTDGAVVIHGGDVDGAYDETVPVACAVITPR